MADEVEEVVASAGKPVAMFAGGKPRQAVVTLEWPVEFDGKTYDSITVRRCTGFEISDYVEAIAAGQTVKPPMVDCPSEVYEALDDDDLFEVDKVVKDFLPRRFRQEAPPTPEASERSSAK